MQRTVLEDFFLHVEFFGKLFALQLVEAHPVVRDVDVLPVQAHNSKHKMTNFIKVI